jgi:hypothetical protein
MLLFVCNAKMNTMARCGLDEADSVTVKGTDAQTGLPGFETTVCHHQEQYD